MNALRKKVNLLIILNLPPPKMEIRTARTKDDILCDNPFTGICPAVATWS
jgi:hypothetical protein